MSVSFFPFVGLLNNLTLLDLATVFTPLVGGLVLLAGLCGLGLGVLLARTDATRTSGAATPHTTPPRLPKAA